MPPYAWITLAAFAAFDLIVWIGDLTPWDFTSLKWFFLFVIAVTVLMRQKEFHR